MSTESLDGRKSSRKTSRLSSSSIMREEDEINSSGFIEGLGGDSYQPPPTAVTRRAESINTRTNQTTGLKVLEQYTKNQSLTKFLRQPLVTQKGCMKMGSARPITSRGLRDSNFLGMRHFQGVLHSKIRDLVEETEKLQWRCNDAQQEYLNTVTYEAKAKELASEITNCQKKLAELNLAFDYINRIGDTEHLEQEVQELEKLNISETRKIEALFNERKLKEDFVHQIDNNELLKKRINPSYSGVKKERHIYLNDRLSQSSRAIGFWEKQTEQYKNVRNMLTQKLKSKLPIMDEIIIFETKLLNLKRMRYTVNENSTFKFNKEREIILETVKQDKSEIIQMENNIHNLTKITDGLQEVMDYLETSDSNVPHSKETINVYLSSFDDNKDNEITKINLLRSEVTRFLTDLNIKLSWISNVTDYINLQENKIGEGEISDKIDLKEEHHKAFNSLKKLELMEFHKTQECRYVDENLNELKHILEEYISLNKMKNKFEIQENRLTNEILQLEKDKKSNSTELLMTKAQLGKLEKEISENPKHKELLYLEKKHCNLEEDIMLMNQTIHEMKITTIHLKEIKDKTLDLMEMINLQLINNYG